MNSVEREHCGRRGSSWGDVASENLDVQHIYQTNRLEYLLRASNKFSVLANFAAESEDTFFTAAAPHNAKLRPNVQKSGSANGMSPSDLDNTSKESRISRHRNNSLKLLLLFNRQSIRLKTWNYADFG